MSGNSTSFPATAERIMVVPNAVARTTVPNSQKSKYRHEISRNIKFFLQLRFGYGGENHISPLTCACGTGAGSAKYFLFCLSCATARRALDRDICHQPL